ncbi:MAG: bifunctional hydroxymethylpyrimidine kinase/phosphomethylpyrimidine kinase [Deferribacteres bacterium]|nr:bifunctional hydroxymethylpyrimidine kinase/phosphomethylpyrimidine kinase [Deferribacteres bacterium]
MEPVKTALTIAGSDPSGGAGLQADLRTFRAMGVYGLCIPAALTAQNTLGVQHVHELPAGFVSEQIAVLVQDIRPDAVKTGMLYTADTVRAVAERIREFSLEKLVVDPVTVSSTGVLLMEDGVLEAVRRYLFPLSTVITPNTYEASVLTGIDIKDERDLRETAVKLREFGPRAVIITGGHLKGRAVDLLFDGEGFSSLENEMLGGEYHGTGCVFSSSLTACLALGLDIKKAFAKAKDFTFNAMKSAVTVGRGMKVLDV